MIVVKASHRDRNIRLVVAKMEGVLERENGML